MAEISITVAEDEALVLFDWLAGVNEDGSLQADPAVRRVLWDLESILESRLTAVLAPDYKDQVTAARARVSAQEG